MAPPQPPERPAVRQRSWRWLPGLLLSLVALTWLFYPSRPLEKPQVLHKAPWPCGNVHEATRSVAIIGAGSAGASTAYYLNKFRDPCQKINITVYERNDYVGGRSTTVNVHDDPNEPVELGASIFVQVNHNLVNAAQELGLPVRGMRATSRLDSPEILGVWDGKEFVFTQSDRSNQYWNLAKLFWKYGMAPLRTQKLMRKTVGSFLKMYDAPHFPFTSLAGVAFDLDLLGATAATGEEFLDANGVGEKFAHDIIQASTRVNYAQNLQQIHGLEAMVCMATDGAMSIDGGNWQIFDNMIKKSGAELLLNASVIAVSKDMASGKYAVKATTPNLGPAQDMASFENSLYDAVVLATPLQFSNITFEPPSSTPPPRIPYVSLHVTLFTSPYRLSPSAFNLPPSASDMPTTILTTTPSADDPATNEIPFFSISTLRTIFAPHPPEVDPADTLTCVTHTNEYLYKIFSPAPLNSSYITFLLDAATPPDSREQSVDDGHYRQSNKLVTWMYEKRWDSYPYLPPRMTFEDMKLDDDGLWYTSGIESFISTMETSSLIGMNVARLVVDGWESDESKSSEVGGRDSIRGKDEHVVRMLPR
ncbi:MAG: hypothetical protein Q9220_006363 [cf. Caloplaca sp. 1 TL-2023]